MRVVMRVVFGLLALLLLAVLGLVLFLPRVLESPETRAAISAAAERQIGRRVEYAGLSLGFLPPSIVVAAPMIAGEQADDPPLLRAEAVSLRLALVPLFSGTVLVDSLVVSGAVLELALTEQGLALPSPPSEGEESVPAPDDAPQAPSISLAVRQVVVRNSSAVLVDRTLASPLTWSLGELNLTARGSEPGEPIAFEAGAVLGTGGVLTAQGNGTLDGALDLTLRLERVAIGPAAPYASQLTRLDGFLSGEIGLQAGEGAVRQTQIELRLTDWAAQTAELAFAGEIDLRAKLLPEKPVDFDIAVRLESGGELRASGRASPAPELDARIELDAVALAPAVAVLGEGAQGASLAGSIEFRGFTVANDPLQIGGELVLDTLRLRLAEVAPITLNGRAEALGDAIRLAELSVEAGGQVMSLSGVVADLNGDMPFDLALASVGVLRANELFGAVTPLKDTLYGPLTFSGRLSGRAATATPETPLSDTLKGHFDFDLGRGVGDGAEGGRLRGVSILRSALGDFEKVGRVVLLSASIARGGSLERFYGEEFERMEGRFAISQGQLQSENLRIVYRGYGVNLRGAVVLADQRLDMTGEIELGGEVVRALGGRAADRKLVIPLASVGGTVAEPELGVSREALVALSRQILATNEVARKATEQIEKTVEKLLPKPADLLEKGLGDLLGRGRR